MGSWQVRRKWYRLCPNLPSINESKTYLQVVECGMRFNYSHKCGKPPIRITLGWSLGSDSNPAVFVKQHILAA